MACPVFSVLHLSDLHLGRDFEDAGGSSREAIAAALDSKAFRMQAHDDLLLLLLPFELSRIANQNQKRFREAGREDDAPKFFDRVIVSGDISTDATDEERFKLAHAFLTSKLRTRGVYGEQAEVGLGVANELLLCVPGNHDKMREAKLDRFNSSFDNSPEKCNYVQILRKGKESLVFIAMDSNAYTDGNIALGEMDTARLSWLTDVLLKMETEGISAGGHSLTVDECANAVKCLLLHHHVCDLSFRKRWFNPSRSFTTMLGSDRLLKVLKGRVDVVIHGHEHFATHFREKKSGTLIVSAGSTSQWHKTARQNSFYNLLFLDDGSLEIHEYIWNGSGFDPKLRDKPVPTYGLLAARSVST